MSTLYFSDILKRTDLDIKKVKLIRHAKSDKNFRTCLEAGFLEAYTSVQRKKFSPGYDYWIVFVSDAGTSAVLEGCYKVHGSEPNTENLMPEGFPNREMFNGSGAYYHLEKTDILKDFEGRLIIDWGGSTRMWHQKATTEKEILAIQAKTKISFTGYEDTILSYEELKEIIDNKELYAEWHASLASVYGIYLITDTISGKLYVGSAYGNQGILQRWTEYVETKHGGNKKIRQLLKEDPKRYKHFQFSILQVVSKTMKPDDVIRLEGIYKDKLKSREFGLNDN